MAVDDPDLVWLWTDDSMKSRAGADFSVAGNAVEFAGIDGGGGGTVRSNCAYSRLHQALQNYDHGEWHQLPVQLPNTANPGWQQ